MEFSIRHGLSLASWSDNVASTVYTFHIMYGLRSIHANNIDGVETFTEFSKDGNLTSRLPAMYVAMNTRGLEQTKMRG